MTTPTTTTPNSTIVIDVDVDLIDRDEANRDTVLDAAFVKSIAEHGILQPVLAVPTEDGRYRLIAGERRVEAARRAEHATVPVVVRDVDDATAGVWQAVENLHRRDLTVSEEAAACARCLGSGMTRKALAAALNRPATWVRSRLAVAGLPAHVQAAIDTGRLEATDAVTLASHADDDELLAAVLDQRGHHDLDRFITQHLHKREQIAEVTAVIEAYADAGIEPATELPRRARGLYELGLTAKDHQSEPCHAITVATGWSGIPSVSEHCTDPKRHKPTGDSDVDSTRLADEDDRKASEREARRVAKAERTELDDFARRAITGKVRAKDIVDLVLPSLLDNLGQTELTDAAKFLGVTEPVEAHGQKDHATPLRTWAAESTANLQRTLMAVAYVIGRDRRAWGRDQGAAAYDAWLARLGYQAD
jgi:ParB/RepB/Spo0J family partition protein